MLLSVAAVDAETSVIRHLPVGEIGRPTTENADSKEDQYQDIRFCFFYCGLCAGKRRAGRVRQDTSHFDPLFFQIMNKKKASILGSTRTRISRSNVGFPCCNPMKNRSSKTSRHQSVKPMTRSRMCLNFTALSVEEVKKKTQRGRAGARYTGGGGGGVSC